jgi:cell division protein FtsB
MRLKPGIAGSSFRTVLQLSIWAVMIAFFVYISYQNLTKQNDIKAEQTIVQRAIDAENEETAELEEELAYQESDEYYEKVAREQLGLVKPDEIIFIPREP